MKKEIQRISFVGLGKLGLPLAGCFAEAGVPTLAIDIDSEKISRLQAGGVPLEEPGLDVLLRNAKGSIEFTAGFDDVAATDATIFLVPTPSSPDKPEFSARFLLAAIRQVAQALASADKHGHCFIISSTVMPGTIESQIIPAIAEIADGRAFSVAYVPDFVALGDVIRGFKRPDFLLVGSADDATGRSVSDLYSRIMPDGAVIEHAKIIEAEIAKISLNTFLSVKISFANFLGQYCARRGDANVNTVTRIVGRDRRISPGYFSAGMAYGGACFPRDTSAFIAMARQVGLDAVQVEATETINGRQKDFAIEQVSKLRPKSVAVLGVSFKPMTPAIEASPSLALIDGLVARGIPVGMFDFSEVLPKQLQIKDAAWCASIEDAVRNHECIVVAHRDDRFKAIVDFLRPDQVVIDFWNILPDRADGRPV